MATSLVQMPEFGRIQLGALAENLVMFDSVALLESQAARVAELLTQIPLKSLESLLFSGSLVIAVPEAAALVLPLNYRDLVAQRLTTITQELNIGPALALTISLSTVGRFRDELEARTKKFLPSHIREKLCASTHLLPFSKQTLHVAKADYGNEAIRSTVQWTSASPAEVLLLDALPRFIGPKFGFKHPSEENLRAVRTIWALIRANGTLAYASQGYSLVVDSDDQPIINAKFHSVHQSNPLSVQKDAFRALLDLQSLPSVESLVNENYLSFDSIIALRNGQGSSFRKWFQSISESPGANVERIVKEYTAMLLAAAQHPSLPRKILVFAVEQLAGLVHPFLGAAVQGVIDFGLPEVVRGTPYLVFDYLKRVEKGGSISVAHGRVK